MNLSEYSLLSPSDIIALRGKELAKVLLVIGARYIAAILVAYLLWAVVLPHSTDENYGLNFWFWAIVAAALAYELALVLLAVGLVLWVAVSSYNAFQSDPTQVMLRVITVTVILILVVLLRRK